MATHKSKGPGEFLRVQFDADPSLEKVIDWLVQGCGAPTRAEVIRHAILLTGELAKQMNEGNKISIVKPNGESEGLRVVFLFPFEKQVSVKPPQPKEGEIPLRISFAETP